MESFDYIIVGGGSAGCALAARLSEDPACSVLVLEAGGADTKELIHVPPAWPALWGSEVDWDYTTTAQGGTADTTHKWPRGKVLGGSSSINAMVFLRGHRADYNGWAQSGALGWGYQDVLPYFKRMECVAGKDAAFRGSSGPMQPHVAVNPNPMSFAFLDAARELGHPMTSDFNGAQQEGAGWHELSIHDGKRQSTAVAYLHPAMGRANLTVLTGAHTRRLILSGARCTGVEYVRDGQLSQASASAEVIVCAGAVDSPRLLLLSGVGPADHLRAVGVKVAHDLRGVGQNLHDHPLLCFVTEAGQVIPPGNNNHAEVSMLFSSRSGLPGPDMQFMFIHVPFHPPGLESAPNSYTFGISAVPISRGSIKLASADPEQKPLINPDYGIEAEDIKRLLFGLKLAREMNATKALSAWGKAEAPASAGVQDEAGLRRFVARSINTYYHPVGSCKMGVDDMAVVDPQLRVHGLSGLRVADASVIPTVPCVNTNPASIMIGEKAADLVRGRGNGHK